MAINLELAFYFGDSRDALFSRDYLAYLPGTELLERDPYVQLKSKLSLTRLYFLHQVHGTAGIVVKKQDLSLLQPFFSDGDYLVTNLSHVGIGVMTADCLPLVFHDPVLGAIAVAHAGWRGAAAGIVFSVFDRLKNEYGVRAQTVTVYLGPCIHACCYQVGSELVGAVSPWSDNSRFITSCYEKTCFDLPGFVAQQLVKMGVKKERIITCHSLCTHCNHQFWSHRRQGAVAGRQMTVVSLINKETSV